MPKKQPVGVGMTPSKTELGKFLRARRLELGLSQVQVAKLTGMCHSNYSQLEVGKHQPVFNANPKRFENLAEALNVEPQDLIVLVTRAEPKTERGKFIRNRREELGLSLGDLAERMGRSLNSVRSLELSKSQGLSYGLLIPLSKALELEPSVLSAFVGGLEKTTNGSLGKLIRERRKESGYSISQLAEKLGVTRQYLSCVELGQVHLSQNDARIRQIAEVLELDAAELLALRVSRKVKERAPGTLGGFLTARRIELSFSQKEAAGLAGISAGSFSNFELGRSCPSSKMLRRLEKALECQILRVSKKLSDFESDPELVRKTAGLLRKLMETRKDDYVVFLTEDDKLLELELLLRLSS